jgi:DNA-binding transcriptional regulator YhcF (GntR family)
MFRVWVGDLQKSDLSKYNISLIHFKLVCLTFSMYGDYYSGTDIRPSWETIAKRAGVNRKTAHKVRDILLEIGIIKQVGKTEKNISIYELSATEEQLSTTDKQLSIVDNQLSTQKGHNSNIYYSNSNYSNVPRKKKEKSKVISWSHNNVTSFGLYGSSSSLDKEII